MARIFNRGFAALILFTAAVTLSHLQRVRAQSTCISVSSSGPVWANSAFVQGQNGMFTAVASATPASSGTDAAIGLTLGAQSTFTGLACIARFNTSGHIDARNGSSYASDATMSYIAGTSYRFRFEVNVIAHTYSVFVAPSGGTEVQIANNYAFRTEQSSVGSLDNFSVFADVGSMQACNFGISCRTAAAGNPWTNAPYSGQAGNFTAQWDATPSAAGLDGVMGLSSGGGSAFTDFAALVRFNVSGFIDARNGASYASTNSLAYAAGQQYHFRVTVNVPAHIYSVYVTPAGGAEQAVALNFDFRTEQNNVTSLSNFGVIVDTSYGAVRACNFLVAADSAVLIQDSFDQASGNITGANYYGSGASFPNNNTSLPSNPSPTWEMGTGFFDWQNYWGYSRKPTDVGTRFFFRLNTRNFNVGDAQIAWSYRSLDFGNGGYLPVDSGEAVDVWLRYQTQYNLYAFQFDRTDNAFRVKRKVPADSGFSGDPGCPANKGVYYVIPTDAQQPGVGAGKLYVYWSDVQNLLPASEASKPNFPNLAHDGTTPYDFKVTVRNVAGQAQIQAYRAGALIYSATDDGRSGVCELPNGYVSQGQDLDAGHFNNVTGWQTSWGLPITAAGATGFRADNIQVWFDNFVVTQLQ